MTDPTLYFVVPLQPKQNAEGAQAAEQVVPCRYFNSSWQPVDPKDITTVGESDSVQFQQVLQLPPAIVNALHLEGREPDLDVSLFAAAAKTLRCSSELARTFEAKKDDVGWFLTVPVARRTRRGVVLVFRRPAEGGAKSLIATTDPEIRNGSSA